jgi:hypothetical protein
MQIFKEKKNTLKYNQLFLKQKQMFFVIAANAGRSHPESSNDAQLGLHQTI